MLLLLNYLISVVSVSLHVMHGYWLLHPLGATHFLIKKRLGFDLAASDWLYCKMIF